MHQGDSDEQDSLFEHQNGQASAKERRNLAEIALRPVVVEWKTYARLDRYATNTLMNQAIVLLIM